LTTKSSIWPVAYVLYSTAACSTRGSGAAAAAVEVVVVALALDEVSSEFPLSLEHPARMRLTATTGTDTAKYRFICTL
jgi:hypothetical protein